jgi:hypothetical protein
MEPTGGVDDAGPVDVRIDGNTFERLRPGIAVALGATPAIKPSRGIRFTNNTIGPAAGADPFPFRCDSPTARRHLEMRLTRRPDDTVQFESVVLASELRVQQPLWDRHVPRGEDLVPVCSWCKRVETAGEWFEVEDAIGRLRLFERHDMPRLSHGICRDCFVVMEHV